MATLNIRGTNNGRRIQTGLEESGGGSDVFVYQCQETNFFYHTTLQGVDHTAFFNEIPDKITNKAFIIIDTAGHMIYVSDATNYNSNIMGFAIENENANARVYVITISLQMGGQISKFIIPDILKDNMPTEQASYNLTMTIDGSGKPFYSWSKITE